MGGYKMIVPIPSPTNPHGFIAIADIRLYMGRSRTASTVYAIAWINTPHHKYGLGVGQAGGWGYDKNSAAIDSALSDAGVELTRSIAGVGESAVREALHAIAVAIGRDDYMIVEY
jgi:hypothetical protein